MKKSGLFAASMAAASATTYSVSSSCSKSPNLLKVQEERLDGKKDEKSEMKKSEYSDKFAPRFDGLRFIETLVTAHR